jgi:hypothetical protein
MAKNKQADDLFDHLRASGVRKKVAKSIADGASSKNAKKAEALAQTALADLRSASDAIRDRVINHRDSERSEAAKKAARTRKRNAAKRSASAKKAAATRKAAAKKSRR